MCYNGRFYNTLQRCEPELIDKVGLSLDRLLKFISVKAESQVIVDHHATVKLSTSLVHTARHATGTG